MSETTQSAMGTVMFVPLTAIQLGKNCRVVDLTTPDGERFVASVKARGVIQPLLVRPLDKELKQLELVAGYRRYFAAQQAGLKSLPVVARPMTDAEVLELQLIENLQREDLAAMDEARALDRLRVELGYSVDDIQAKIFAQTGKNVSRSHVYDTLSLVKLTAKAEAALREGKITRSQAIEIARLDADLQDNAVTRFAQSENSHRDSLRYIRDQFATEQEKKTRWAKAAKDAAARNIPVLSPKEAKALFPQEWSDRADAASGYVALSQVHYEDPKRRTFSQILGKANVAKSLVSCHGEPMFVVKIGDVAPILNKLKVPVPGEAKKAAADKAAATETKEQRTKRLAAEALALASSDDIPPAIEHKRNLDMARGKRKAIDKSKPIEETNQEKTVDITTREPFEAYSQEMGVELRKSESDLLGDQLIASIDWATHADTFSAFVRTLRPSSYTKAVRAYLQAL